MLKISVYTIGFILSDSEGEYKRFIIMFKKLAIPITFILMSIISNGQEKKVLSHDDYDLWKRITATKISKNGKLVVTEVGTTTKRGDGYIEIYNTQKGTSFKKVNGYESLISNDEKFIFFKQKPLYQKIRSEKKKEVKKGELSKDSWFVYNVDKNKIEDSLTNVKSFAISKANSKWVLVEKFKNKTKKKNKGKNVAAQNYLLVYNISSKKKDTIFKIKEYNLAEKGNVFYYSLKNKKEKARDLGIYKYDLSTNKRQLIDSTAYVYNKIAVNKNGTQLAYISVQDSTSKDSLQHSLKFYKNDNLNTLSLLLKNDDLLISGDQLPFFSDAADKLYFYTKEKKVFHQDTTLLKEEIPEVDVWNWKDKLIQPEQKSKIKELQSKAYLSYYNIKDKKIVSLQDNTIDDVLIDDRKSPEFYLGVTSSLYDVQRSWDFPWTRDYFYINKSTGEKRLLLKEITSRPIITPDEKKLVYYNSKEKNWFSLDIASGEHTNLTKDISVAFYNEDHDEPSLPSSYGFSGFDADGNILLNDKYDIWKISLENKFKPNRITKNGRETKITFRGLRLYKEKPNAITYLKKELLIIGYNNTTKTSGVYVIGKHKITRKVDEEYQLGSFRKAENASVFTFTRQNFNTYPDLTVTKDFKSLKKITNINPQQEEFYWGTSEAFSWTAYDGRKLEGILYKPENFDPEKKYPLMTYFYDRSSDNLNKYYSPQPSASIVNPSYLVSNQYIMFVPDIVYNEGKPGESAYNCVVSGVEAVESLGYIDSSKMAIQGQSWGGYQVAYLITRTNKFRAAMAGAPVSNMTSAYGGIRWKSGLSRAFQYEKTQSRIGKNLWDGFDLYIENSPLFKIPKIETPLLMMHNDNDGAVPYYQGIEMFMGMRRLQKPVWLLVYNNEAHNLRKVKNKQDLSIRMMQFFDYYLKDQPAPEWMTKGVPRTQKGKDFGYSLSDE